MSTTQPTPAPTPFQEALERMEARNEKIQRLEQELSSAQAALAAKEREIERLRDDLSDYHLNAQKACANLNDAATRAEKAEADRDRANAECDRLIAERDSAEAERDQLRAEVEALTSDVERYGTAVAEADQLRAESLEQSRLLGMSGEREAKHLAQIESLRAEVERLTLTTQELSRANDRTLGEMKQLLDAAAQDITQLRAEKGST